MPLDFTTLSADELNRLDVKYEKIMTDYLRITFPQYPKNLEDFAQWRENILTIVESFELDALMEKGFEQPDFNGPANQRALNQQRQQIFSKANSLFYSILRRCFLDHPHCIKAAGKIVHGNGIILFQNLVATHHRITKDASANLRGEFYTLKQADTSIEAFGDFASHIRTSAEQLQDLSIAISDNEMKSVLSTGMKDPSEDQHIKEAAEDAAADDAYDFERVRESIESKLTRLFRLKPRLFSTKPKKEHLVPAAQHYYCPYHRRMVAHTPADCSLKDAAPSTPSGPFRGKCNSCGQTGHRAFECSTKTVPKEPLQQPFRPNERKQSQAPSRGNRQRTGMFNQGHVQQSLAAFTGQDESNNSTNDYDDDEFVVDSSSAPHGNSTNQSSLRYSIFLGFINFISSLAFLLYDVRPAPGYIRWTLDNGCSDHIVCVRDCLKNMSRMVKACRQKGKDCFLDH